MEGQRRLEHLVVHSCVAYCGSWGGLSTVGGHGIVAALSSREVVGHLRIKLLDSLLLLALTSTAALSTSSGGLATSLSSGRSGLVGGGRLRLVLLRLSTFMSGCQAMLDKDKLT